MQLSEHFSRKEFEASATAAARGINNVMPDRIVPAAKAWCLNIGEPVRAHFRRPVRLNSGYRCAALNRAVGSSSTSQHGKGEAADIEIEGVSNYDLADWIRRNLQFDQLILEAYRAGEPSSGWVHVSWTTRQMRRAVLTMNLGSHGAAYQQGLHA
jgi:zinc D-Ala-D-Ala carboxypeptidase